MPRLPDPTAEQAALLGDVAQIADARREMDRAYVDAIVIAHRAGLSSAYIARAAGVTYQAVQSIVRRHA